MQPTLKCLIAKRSINYETKTVKGETGVGALMRAGINSRKQDDPEVTVVHLSAHCSAKKTNTGNQNMKEIGHEDTWNSPFHLMVVSILTEGIHLGIFSN